MDKKVIPSKGGRGRGRGKFITAEGRGVKCSRRIVLKIPEKVLYLVRWKGYPDSFNTWVKEEDMNAPELIKDFNNK